MQSFDSRDISDKLVFFTKSGEDLSDKEKVSFVAKADKPNSVNRCRKRTTQKEYNSLYRSTTTVYPLERLVNNGDFTARITGEKSLSSDYSYEHTVVEVSKEDIKYSIDILTENIIGLLSNTNVINGTIQDKFSIALSSRGNYLVKDSELKNIEHSSNKSSIKMTTVYEIGQVYCTKNMNNPSIYCGILYNHIECKSRFWEWNKRYYWMNKPSLVHVFIPLAYAIEFGGEVDSLSTILDNLTNNVKGQKVWKMAEYCTTKRTPKAKFNKRFNADNIDNKLYKLYRAYVDTYKDNTSGLDNYELEALFSLTGISETDKIDDGDFVIKNYLDILPDGSTIVLEDETEVSRGFKT